MDGLFHFFSSFRPAPCPHPPHCMAARCPDSCGPTHLSMSINLNENKTAKNETVRNETDFNILVFETKRHETKRFFPASDTWTAAQKSAKQETCLLCQRICGEFWSPSLHAQYKSINADAILYKEYVRTQIDAGKHKHRRAQTWRPENATTHTQLRAHACSCTHA